MAQKLKETRKVRDQERENQRVIGGSVELRSKLKEDYTTSQNALRYFSLSWNEYEDLISVKSRTADNSRRRLSDGTLSSIVIERAGRNASQMPIGEVRGRTISQLGQGQLMDLVLHKYILPNANEQYDFPTKLFLWNMYANTYGTMAMQYDWTTKRTYSGPDCWLIPIRNFFPQQGRFSVQNSDFVFVSNFVSRDFLLDKFNDDNDNTWDKEALERLLNETKDRNLVPKARYDYLRVNPEFEYRRRAAWTDTGQIEVVTKFEASLYSDDDPGSWISFCPDYDNIIIRNIENPHQNGVIPIVEKFAIPSLDSIIGFGDAERGALLQDATDTTLNLQVDGQKLRTYPPLKIVNGNVVVPSIRYTPAAKWLMMNPNDITHHQFPEVDTSTNQIYQYLKGALNNVAGNTTTQISAENTDTLQGKTPASIKAQQATQSTRDAIDLMFQDQSTEKLINGMLDLVAHNAENRTIELYGYGQEVAQIAQKYPDIAPFIKYQGKNSGVAVSEAPAIKISLGYHDLKTEKGYNYKIHEGSTKLQDRQEQNQYYAGLLDQLLPQAAVINQLVEMDDKTIDWGELILGDIRTIGIRNVQDIIKPMTTGTPPGMQGAPQQGNGQTGSQVKPPNELINFKDLASVSPQSADAMLQQAGLPPIPAQTQQPVQPQSAPQTPQPAQQQQQPQAQPPQPDITAALNKAIGIPEAAQAQAAIQARHQQLMEQIQGVQNGTTGV